MRAARERAGLTQEQVAGRVNVSIHTLRRWDRGRNRPSRPEQMQLLAAVLGTRIGVIWPATDDPLVAEALRLEQQRGVPSVPGPTQARARAGSTDGDDRGGGEIQVRRLEKPRVASRDDVEPELLNSESGSRGTDENVPPGEAAPRPVPDGEERGAAVRERQEAAGGLPPWPAAEPGEEPLTDHPPVTSDPHELERPVPEVREDVQSFAAVGSSVDGSSVTMLAAAPSIRRRVKRAVVAIGVAVVVGGVGMVAAGALGEQAADGDPSVREAEQAAQRERAAAAARARDVTTMRAAAERGDYDAAIAQGRQLDDVAAVAAYRESAARVVVGRADKAARRGDLSLARSRLRAAKRRYASSPGADAVQKRIRRIERQRKEQAQRERAAARRAAAAALAAQRRAAASAAAASAPTVTNTPAPSAAGAPQSSTPAPSSSSSSSSKGSGSGGGSGKKKDPEEAVDPGLF